VLPIWPTEPPAGLVEKLASSSAPATALRQWQIQASAGGEPWTWAGYVIAGDWR
jgi:hypothetical protein